MSESWQREQRERNRDSRPSEPHTEQKFRRCQWSPSPATSSESPFFVGENTQQPACIWGDVHELREWRNSSASTQGYMCFSIWGSQDASFMSHDVSKQVAALQKLVRSSPKSAKKNNQGNLRLGILCCNEEQLGKKLLCLLLYWKLVAKSIFTNDHMYTCDIHKGYPWKKSRECSHGTFHKVKQQPLQLQPEGLKKKKKSHNKKNSWAW